MSDKIQVAVKVRPFLPREKGSFEHCTIVGNEITLMRSEGAGAGETYVFDHVFDKSSSNYDVFENVVKPLVDRTVKGFNATIFAYGQTSSGKTHTMLGDSQEVGIVQLAVSTMFDYMKKSEGREFLIRASYMEIYNEKVNDLLEQQNTNLKIKETEGRIVVSRLKEELVADTVKVMNLVKRGQKIRRIGETNLNERSSRSHTIFRMIIESRLCDDNEGTIQVSQLNLVDLAGSERAGLAGTTGERLKEGCSINRSLFQLSQVVSQLSEGQNFINFRDSKLTRILQPSLGGNAHTLIVCTITPACYEFTQSTLGFALRAKSVKNRPEKNEVMSDGTLIKKYARQLEKLQAELKAAKERNPVDKLEAVESKLEEQERINNELQQRISLLMKSFIVSKPKAVQQRRRTWAGGKTFDRLGPRYSTLGTIEEIPAVDTSLVIHSSDMSFSTPYEDFEVQLIQDEREKLEDSIPLPATVLEDSRFTDISSRLSACSEYVQKKETEVQTSPCVCTTLSTDHEIRTPPVVLYSRIEGLQKEWNELSEFTKHEKNIMDELEQQLKSKEEKCLTLEKSLAEKEKILMSTLSLQESLTQKLMEYDSALQKNKKALESCRDPNEIKALELEVEELHLHTRESNEQIAAYKRKLYNEVISLDPNSRSKITQNSEPSELLNVLMSCIMEKEMEVMNQVQVQLNAQRNCTGLEEMIKDLESSLLETKVAFTELEQQKMLSESEFSEKEKKLLTKLNELNSVNMSLEDQMLSQNNLVCDMQVEMKHLKNKLNDQDSKIKALLQEVNLREDETKTLILEKAGLQQQLDEKTSYIDNLQPHMREQNIKPLEKQRAVEQNSLTEENLDKDDLESHFNLVSKENEAIKELNNKIERLKSENYVLIEQMQHKIDHLEKLRMDSEEAFMNITKERDILQLKVDEIECTLNEKDVIITELREYKLRLEHKSNSMKDCVEEVIKDQESYLEDRKSSLFQLEKQKLQSECDFTEKEKVLHENLNDLKSINDSQEVTLLSQKQCLDDMQNEIKQLKIKLHDKESEIIVLLQEVNQHEDQSKTTFLEKSSFQKQLEEKDSYINDLRQHMEEENIKLIEKQSGEEVERLTEENLDLELMETSLKLVSTENLQEKETMKKLNELIENLKKENGVLIEEMELKNNHLEKLRLDNEEALIKLKKEREILQSKVDIIECTLNDQDRIITNLENSKLQLEEQLKSQKDCASLEEIIKNLESSLEERKSALFELEKQKLQSECDFTEKEKVLHENLNDLKSINDSQEVTLLSQKQCLDDMQDEIKQLKIKLNDKESEIVLLQEVNRCENQSKSMFLEKSSFQKQLEEKDSYINDLRQHMEEKNIKLIKEQSGEEVKRLTEGNLDLELSESSLKLVSTENLQENETIKELNEMIESLKSENVVLIEEMELKNNHLEKLRLDSEEALMKLTKEREILQSKVCEIECTLNDKDVIISELRECKLHLEEQLKSRKDCACLEGMIKNLESSLEERKSALFELEKQKLQSECDFTEKEKVLHENLNDLKSVNDSQEVTLLSQKQCLDDMQDEIKQLKIKLNDKESEIVLLQEVNRCENQSKSMFLEKSSFQKQLEEKDSYINDLRQHMEEKNIKLIEEQSGEEVNSLTEENLDLELSESSLKLVSTENLQENETIKELNEMIESLKSENVVLMEEMELKNNHLEKLRLDSEEALMKLTKEREILQSKVGEIESTLNVKDVIITELRECKLHLEEQLNSHKDCASLWEMIRTLETSVEERKVAYTELEKQNLLLKSEIIEKESKLLTDVSDLNSVNNVLEGKVQSQCLIIHGLHEQIKSLNDKFNDQEGKILILLHDAEVLQEKFKTQSLDEINLKQEIERNEPYFNEGTEYKDEYSIKGVLKEDSSNKKEVIDEVRKLLDSLKAENTTLKEVIQLKIGNLEKLRLDSEETIMKLTKERGLLQSKVDQIERTLNDQDKLIMDLKESKLLLEIQLNSHKDCASLGEMIRILETSVEERKVACTELEKQNLLLKSESIEKERELQAKLKILNSVNDSLEVRMLSQHQLVDDMQIEIKHLKNKLNDQENKITVLLQDAKVLEDEAKTYNVERTKIQEELCTITNIKCNLETKYHDEVESNFTLKVQCDKLQKNQNELELFLKDYLGKNTLFQQQECEGEECMNVTESLKSLKIYYNGITKQKQDLENRVTSLEGELCLVKSQNQELKLQCELLKEKVSVEEKLHSRIKHLEEVNGGLEENITSELQQKGKLLSSIQEVEKKLCYQKEEFLSLVREKDIVENKVKYYSALNTELKNNLEILQMHKSECELKLEKETQDRNCLLEKIKNLEKHIVLQESAAEELDRTKFDLANLMESLKNKVPLGEHNALKVQLDGQLLENKKLQNEVIYLRQVVSEQEEKCLGKSALSKENLHNLVKEKETLSKMLEDRSNAFKDIEQQLQNMMKQNEVFKCETERLQVMNIELGKMVQNLESSASEKHLLDQSTSRDENFHVTFAKVKEQLFQEVKLKQELEQKLLSVQNELLEAKQKLEKETPRNVNEKMGEILSQMDKVLTEKEDKLRDIDRLLKRLFVNFPGVTTTYQNTKWTYKLIPHVTLVQNLENIVSYLEKNGLSSIFEKKDSLESKVLSLEKTVQFLQETLKKEGYRYEEPFWVRTGNWAISNRKMRDLERLVHELQEEKKNWLCQSEMNASSLDDSQFPFRPKPLIKKVIECSNCNNLRKELDELHHETAMKNLQLTNLTSRLESIDLQYKKNIDSLEEKVNGLTKENKQLHDVLSLSQEQLRKYQIAKYCQSTQTDTAFPSWESVRAFGSGSKIVNDHINDVNARRMLRLEEENGKLKRLVLDLRRNAYQQDRGSGRGAVISKPSKPSPSAASPRRKAALERVIQESTSLENDGQPPRLNLSIKHGKENVDNPNSLEKEESEIFPKSYPLMKKRTKN